MRACVEYSQTREFEKALDYADVSQRVVSDAGPFDDVCKYRSSMINCSCQDTRYFARAYRNPVSTGETDSAYNFRSPTVGEFSPLSPLSLPPGGRCLDAKLSRVSPRLSSFPLYRHPPLSSTLSPNFDGNVATRALHSASNDRNVAGNVFVYRRKKIWKEIFLLSLLNFFYS